MSVVSGGDCVYPAPECLVKGQLLHAVQDMVPVVGPNTLFWMRGCWHHIAFAVLGLMRSLSALSHP